MALFVPYMYILAFADTIPIILSPWYITALCIGSMIGRLGVLLGYDFTFGYNRSLYVMSVVGKKHLLLNLLVLTSKDNPFSFRDTLDLSSICRNIRLGHNLERYYGNCRRIDRHMHS
jgi:hypothetical protein